MKRFDCLSPECPLFGPHLLEASAGTGKTFSIEHIFLRLLLESKESPLQIEEILVVTFTRAATRELKGRIRTNLEEALSFLRGDKEGCWPYLKPWVASPEGIKILTDALSIFDRCQIFTIHGFCYRMLREFAFEAGFGFALADPDQERNIPQEMRHSLSEFFAKGVGTDLCAEQIALLFGQYDSMEEISRTLLRSQKKNGPSFPELFQRYQKAVQTVKHPLPSLEELRGDFEKVRSQFKSQVRGDFDRQIEWLAKSFSAPSDPLPFQKLIGDRGTLLAYLHPSNKKVKPKEGEPLCHPGFFDWAASILGPIVEEASDWKKICSTLISSWKKWEEKSVSERDFLQPDEILSQMQKSIDVDSFLDEMRHRFKAVIIDEFQDTDPTQWEIFRKIFLEAPKPLQAFYLVGDPKQSIYRFRSADVYTYFAARDFLGEENLYHLDTNFRSSQELIGSLNALFNRKWLSLPKIRGAIPYLPVKAGSSVFADFLDEKRALHWIVGGQDANYHETFLPYAVGEIERLKPASFSSIALLVKDRYEAESALHLFSLRGIPAIARSHQSLGKTEAFRQIRELLEAVSSPYDEGREKIVKLGPFDLGDLSLSSWKTVIEERGLVSFFTQFFSGKTSLFDSDYKQILEELFAWQQENGFSFEGLQRVLDEIEKREADEGGRRRMEEADDAVQIMTLHISKGLEFEVVFALGLASCSREEETEIDEQDAEKLRQLYVAMTRAKKRLYVPVKKVLSSKGPFSPIDLFIQKIEKEEGDFFSFLDQLSKKESVSFEEVPSPFPPLPPVAHTASPSPPLAALLPRVLFSSSYLHSFTSLAKSKESQHGSRAMAPVEEKTLQTLPCGPETGIVVHQIFESLFSSDKPIWRDDPSVDFLVEKELQFSPLLPWVKPIQEMVRTTLSLPLSDGKEVFCLKQLDTNELFVEMEFLYCLQPHFVKGFIDLVFSYRNQYYFLDWKTNWLKESTEEAVRAAIEAHDYGLQATLYAEALRRHMKSDALFEQTFGGAFYLFVRSGIYTHFKPDMSRLGNCYGN